MSYEPNEHLILQMPVPPEELEFSGERFTTAVQGEVRHEHLHRYLFALQFCRNKHVLDVASGEGYGAALLSNVARSVTGIDVSQEAVTHAQRSYPGARYIAGLAESLPLSERSIDVVVSFETIEHLVEHIAFLREIKRVLKPDGILVMSSPDRNVYSGEQGINNPHHLKELSKTEFQALIREHFEHTCFFGQISMTGSVVVPDGGGPGELRAQGFRHQGASIIEAAPGVLSATYIISVATNGPMPKIFTGVFDDRPFQLGLYDELQQRHIRILQGESEIKNLRNELEAGQERLRQSEAQGAELSNKVAELSTAIEELRLSAASNVLAQDSRQRQLDQLTTEATALKDELSGKQTEIQNLMEATARDAALVGALETQLAVERKTAMERMAEAEHRAEAERRASSALSAKYMAVKAQFDAVCASKSWQLSQPIRDLAAVKSSFPAGKHSAGLLPWLAMAISSVRRSKTINLLRRGGLFDAAYYLDQNPDVAAKKIDPLLHYVERGVTEGRSPNPLFDTLYYLKQSPDVAQAGVNPLAHYVQAGWKEGREPHTLFDTAYYLQQNPDAAQTGVNPLAHYLEAGWKEHRDPHPLFDVSYYLDKNPDVAQAGIDPLSHYLLQGWKERRSPHPLFDISYYLDNNPDVAQADIDPLLHYLLLGWKEHRNPHPLFDISYYLDHNPDVAQADIDPLLHYLLLGWKERRSPHPLFDIPYYLDNNPEVTQTGINPLLHYLRYGWREHRNPHPLFDISYYLDNNPDVTQAGIDPLSHYLLQGWKERRSPHPLFDISYYLGHNPDIAQADIDPLLHYLLKGWKERRNPHPLFDISYVLTVNPDLGTEVEPLTHYVRRGAVENRNPHPLFHSRYYLEQNPDVATAGVNPLAHYCEAGFRERRNPNPLFDSHYYLETNSDLHSGVNPLVHFITQGAAAGRCPHPLFDTTFYSKRNPDVIAAGVNPLAHFLSLGFAENRDPHPLFHSRYYLEQNPDIVAAGINPLAHYCEAGFREDRNPNPLFDSRYYLETNSDLHFGANPLVHFITQGAAAGRCPHPLFDTTFYSKRNPDVIAAGANPLAHFLSSGFSENRDPHPLFDLSFYIVHSPWILQAMQNPVIHYLTVGAWEGKDPHPHFDTNYYLDTYPEVRSTGINPLVHYITYGRDHGYEPNPYYKTFLSPTANLDFSVPSNGPFQTEQQHQPLHYRPLISVVMPTYNSPTKYLELAIRSVQQQTYTNWELCICDDGSSSEQTLELLHREADRDSRICLQCNSENGGISYATNQAMAWARGEFVALMDHDDELTKDALFEIVSAINTYPEADVLYSDQDYINEDGSLHQQFFKPDWSPDLFRGVMYVGHLLVVRRTLVVETGGCDSRFDFVQDFEFMLRLSERTQRIVHVPRILYHWRRIQGSVALHGDEKPGIESLQADAVNAHLKRCGIPAIAASNPSHAHRLLICPEPRNSSPAVMILLDLRSESSDMARSMASTFNQTTSGSFDIGIIESAGRRTGATSLPFRVLGNTLSSALEKTNSEFVVLIRPVIEIFSPNWLSHLLLYAEQPGIACVGPLILRPDGKVSSAGLIVTGGSEVRMAMRGFPPNSDGYAGSLSCAREVAALDSSCVMVEARKLRQLAFLDEYETSSYQVIDICMRAAQKGLRNICNPRAVVKTFEPTSPENAPVFDRVLFQNLWEYEASQHDPYYNPNFGNADFGAAVAAR